MGRGRCDDPPADPLVSEFRILLSRVDRTRSAACGDGPTAVAPAGANPGLGGGNSLLLHNLLLAYLLDDPLRGSADGRCLRVTNSGSTRDWYLSRSDDDADGDGDQAVGYRVGTTRAHVLDRLRVGPTRCDGSTMERTRLLAGFLFDPDWTGNMGWSLRSQLFDCRCQRCVSACDCDETIDLVRYFGDPFHRAGCCGSWLFVIACHQKLLLKTLRERRRVTTKRADDSGQKHQRTE